MKRLVIALFCFSAAFSSRGANPGLIEIKNPEGQLAIDGSGTGQVVSWKAGDLAILHEKAESPVRLVYGPEKSEAFFVPTAASRSETKEHGWKVEIAGVIGTASEPLLKATMVYEIAPDFQQMDVGLKLTQPSPKLTEIHELAWRLPLSLNPRKRVYYRGDHGLDWETRYFYQFHTDSGGALFKTPERNEWRYFALDQFSRDAFRLWKAESDRTPLLSMQEGKTAAPYVQVFDERGGVSLQYPQLAELAPKSLRVDAAGGATLSVQLWTGSLHPLAAHSPEAERVVFNTTHRFRLHADGNADAVLAERASLNAANPPSAKVDANAILQEPEWLRKAPLSTLQPLYVTGGYPFARGECQPGEAVEVKTAGKPVPVQSKPLAYWPDGSVKWMQLTFPFDAALAVADAKAPYISLRNEQRIPVAVQVGNGSRDVKLRAILSLEKQADNYRLITGPLTLELTKGVHWLRSLVIEGNEVLRPKAEEIGYANYLLDYAAAKPGQIEAEGGHLDDKALDISDIAVVEKGPLRTVLRLTGTVPNREPTRVILWIEALAGRSDLKITHTVEFLFADPRKTMLTGLGLRFPLDFDAATQFNAAGFAGAPASGQTGNLGLLQLTPGYSEISRRDSSKREVLKTGAESQGWIAASDRRFRMVGAIRDFWQMAPKGIVAKSDPGEIDYELWPGDAMPMDVRRYSNYPHRSQGELAGTTNETFEKSYYANEPFVGTSHSQDLYLGLFAPGDPVNPESLVADFQSPALLYAGAHDYAKIGMASQVFDLGKWPRAGEGLTNYAKFFLFHRELHRWYGHWNFGDFRHAFQTGYGTILSPRTIASLLESKETPPKTAAKGDLIKDYDPPNDWAYDNGRWGWGNTEGLPNDFLQGEYLRTGNRTIFFASEAMARHARDVVVRHAGKWFGAGTRHGVQPWSDGDHEERQTVALEWRMHYFLTGEPRTRDVIEALYTKHYCCKPATWDADHSGRLPGLLFHWELTNSAQEAEQLKRYVHLFTAPTGIYEAPNVQFPGPVAGGPPQKLNSGSMFFHTFGAMQSLLEYEQLTGDPQLAKSLIASADKYLNDEAFTKKYLNRTTSPLVMFPICFAARSAEDPARYRKFLARLFEANAWKMTYQLVTKNPAHWTGSSAYLIGSLTGSLFYSNFVPYVVGTLGGDQIWTPQIARQVEEREAEGTPKKRPVLSWQSNYDGVPEISAYLQNGQPWLEVGGSKQTALEKRP